MFNGFKYSVQADPSVTHQPPATTANALDFGACSDTGCVRQNNEDGFLVDPYLNLFVLSDGMGGQACGEVASRLTVEAVAGYCRQAAADPSCPLVGKRMVGVTATANRLASAIRSANDAVRREAHEHPSQEGMGATVVAVRCVDDRMSFAHVGDSRLYLFRNDRLVQMTQDHSLVAEQVRHGTIAARDAGASRLQSILIRAVGAAAEVEVDIGEASLMDGDAFLLCSDGLTRELSDAQIAAILNSAADPQEAADDLVTFARKAGGEDNITVIVARYALNPSTRRLGKWFQRLRRSS